MTQKALVESSFFWNGSFQNEGSSGNPAEPMDQSAWNSEFFLETVGLGDFKGLFQPQWHCDSMKSIWKTRADILASEAQNTVTCWGSYIGWGRCPCFCLGVRNPHCQQAAELGDECWREIGYHDLPIPIPLLPIFPHHSMLELHSPQLLSEMSIRAAAGRAWPPRRPEMTPPNQSHGISVCFNPKLPHWPLC